MSGRLLKVNELIKQQLGVVINEEIDLPAGVLVTITKIETSPDLRHARVFVSILPDEKARDILGLLIRKTKTFQKELADKIILRVTPRIRFIIDESEQKAGEIDRLLDSLE